jgi:sortase (surface protein transpeptidase)
VPPVGEAGWFDAGPRPGETGRAVVIGHLDTHDGPGLFAKVPSLSQGTRIDLLDRRGGVHLYSVVGTAQVSKKRFPSSAVYGASDAPVLVLITCGGRFQNDHYRDNVLLYARAA